MTGKKYDIEGKVMTLQREEGDFAYFDNNVAIKRFLLGTKYDEYMDPADFFNATGNLNKIAEQLKSTDPKMFENNNGGGTQVNTQNLYQNTVDKIVPPVQKYVPENNVHTNTTQNYNFEKQPIQPTHVNNQVNNVYQPESPELSLFKKLKRSNKVSFDIKIDEMIPTFDFIRMMNENFETSIIDYVSTQAIEKLLKDPTLLRKQIKQQLEIMVYGKVQEDDVEIISEQEESTEKLEIKIIEEPIQEHIESEEKTFETALIEENVPQIEIKIIEEHSEEHSEEHFEEHSEEKTESVNVIISETKKSETLNTSAAINIKETDLSADA